MTPSILDEKVVDVVAASDPMRVYLTCQNQLTYL